ncbi:GNAT family N-acetyltransferase [Cupriavidus sp. 8B]
MPRGGTSPASSICLPCASECRSVSSASNATAQEDASADRTYQFLVKRKEVIVGRVNLGGVTRPYFNKASLGYRIGERFAGDGYATKAVELVLSKARDDFDLRRIEATVGPENQASSRVLTRNGFAVYGTARRSMKLHGTLIRKYKGRVLPHL